jgi:ADP-ribosylglycohydrolase
MQTGGDADTQVSIAGAIAEADYGGVPEPIGEKVKSYLPYGMLLFIANEFMSYVIQGCRRINLDP